MSNLFSQFPVTDTTQTNLDWIIGAIKDLQEAIQNADFSTLTTEDAEKIKSAVGIYEQFPYGDTTKTNLDWILTEIHNLRSLVDGKIPQNDVGTEQSDSDFQQILSGNIYSQFPYSDTTKTNLDWILSTIRKQTAYIKDQLPSTDKNGAFLRHINGKNVWVNLVNADTEGR